ncbi:MAG TPA: ABC transporter ATP-binding protein [Thermodesulfobacteriota bacterium]
MSGPGRVTLRGVVKRHGAVAALKGVNLDIRPGEFFALLGPSGSGKTTTLRIIAGLETVDEGSVHIDGADVTRLPPGDRDVAMVFQSYALYPHMTVFDNIAFPLRMVGTPKAEIAARVAEAAGRLQIGHLVDRRPGQLSGGQQQRTALARAIVRRPTLFLLDEPLSNLDARLRLDTRVEIKTLHQTLGVTTIYVTHDQEEAMTLADRMAVFVDGEIVQVGTPEEVFDRPNSVKVAAFLGNPPMNLVRGMLAGGRLVLEGHAIPMPGAGGNEPREVTVGIRPGDLRLERGGIPATVYLSEVLGEGTILNLRLGESLVKARIPAKRRMATGAPVEIGFDPACLHLFDRTSGLRIATALEKTGA